MLKFSKPDIEDLSRIYSVYSLYCEYTCEYTLVNYIIWGEMYDFQVAFDENDIFIKTSYENETIFCLPFSKNIKKAVLKIKEYCDFENIPLIFSGVAGERFNRFIEAFPGEFDITQNRDYFEYIYLKDELINLSGKKYHSKRNHISKFNSLYEWKYEELNESNLKDAIAMITKWYNSREADETLSTERAGVLKILDAEYFKKIKGGCILVDGRVIAVTFGCPINDKIFDINFEKALPEYDGAYSVINNEFVKKSLTNYKYINREDDLGLEGLRRSKMSYYPKILLEKYLIKEKNNG